MALLCLVNFRILICLLLASLKSHYISQDNIIRTLVKTRSKFLTLPVKLIKTQHLNQSVINLNDPIE